MGEIAKAQQEAPVAKRGGFKDVLASNWPRIQAVMPKHMSQERMFQLALSCYNTTPKLSQCSAASVLSCVMKCSALGLEPSAVDGLGRAYILPYSNKRTGGYEATFILGYKGMLDLCRRSGELRDVSARAVYEGDLFEFEFGLEETLRHVPGAGPRVPGKLTHVYAVAHFKDGGHYVDVMTKAEVDAIRARSMAADKGPWVTDYEAMAKKTVLRRAFPYLPVSIEAQTGVAGDEATPRFVDSDGVIFDLPDDEPAEPVEAEGVEVGEPAPEREAAGEVADHE